MSFLKMDFISTLVYFEPLWALLNVFDDLNSTSENDRVISETAIFSSLVYFEPLWEMLNAF